MFKVVFPNKYPFKWVAKFYLNSLQHKQEQKWQLKELALITSPENPLISNA